MLIKCPECARDISDTAPACPGCGYVPSARPAEPPPWAFVESPKLEPWEFGPERPSGVSVAVGQQILVEQRLANEGPSTAVAYLLWFFLGLFGAHRFYVGRTASAVVMLVLTITVAGVVVAGVWWLVDAFLIPDMLRTKRQQLRAFYARGAIA